MNRHNTRAGVCLALLLGLIAPLSAAPFAEEFETKPWQEAEIQLPPYPEAAGLYSFYVSPTTEHRFFVDLQTLSVGQDEVVRYTLMVISPSGAKNVSFEGMHCREKTYRIYALGRADGTWSKTRHERWLPVPAAVSNRHHAALYAEFFCPGGSINYRLEDIQKAIKKEGRPFSESEP
jgi:hypothetical protein